MLKSVSIIVIVVSLLLSSCSIIRQEGSTSPCYGQKHYVGYGPGGYGKGRIKN